MFQFLIGSLGTFQEYSPRGKSRQFQFLIGSLGTLTYKAVYGIIFQFQFLIGSLGTLLKITKQEASESFNSLQVVQVLGRIRGRRLKNYSFNSLQVVQVHTQNYISHSSIHVSIPYRQSRYSFRPQMHQCYNHVSIPYRQSRYLEQAKDRIHRIGVSIPYRQSRYTLPTLCRLLELGFQFLIGSLGT